MAMDKFRYSPNASKTSAASNIRSAMHRHKMSMEEETILAHLREASKEMQEDGVTDIT